MTRIHASRNTTTRCITWGKKIWGKKIAAKRNLVKKIWGQNAGALVFAAVLIICSVTVGCSSDKPKSVSTNQISVPQMPTAVEPASTPALQAENKPAHKKIVHRKPATVNYTDKTYGVTFEYPRRYAIETGDAATSLVASTPLPMNFVQPGGVAVAAVELPETSFVNTDFSSAFFNVSVHKTLTADQCSEFAVPQPAVAATDNAPAQSASSPSATASASTPAEAQAASATSPAPAAAATTASSNTEPVAATAPASSQPESQGSKLMIGDLELHGTEAVAGEGTRQSDSKYFHVYQNGACYEFALNVTTDASENGIVKHVDRDKVFNRLEAILSTVKIDAANTAPAAAQDAKAEAPKTPAAAPAQ